MRITQFASVLLICLANISSGIQMEKNQGLYKQYQEVFELIENKYFKAVDKKKLLQGAIEGMLNTLDPYSVYFADEDDFMVRMKGEFGGVGIQVVNNNNVIKIVASIKNLPADKAGILAGDIITAIDDETVSGLQFDQIVKKMRGESGTEVKLTIIREAIKEPQDFILIREIIKVPSVVIGIKDNIVYISLMMFNKNTATDLRQEMQKLIAAGHRINGLVLDLRGNAGGMLDQAIGVADYFLESGLVVSTVGRTKDSEIKYYANPSSIKNPRVPLVVLINKGSASASEIVAAAIQHHRRGVLLGTSSFGKGSVQSIITLSDNKVIKLTTAEYYTPSGASIQTSGVTPDIIVEQVVKTENPKVKEQISYIDATAKNSIKSERSAPIKYSDSMLDMEDLYENDYQYARAIDLIRGINITMRNATITNETSK